MTKLVAVKIGLFIYWLDHGLWHLHLPRLPLKKKFCCLLYYFSICTSVFSVFKRMHSYMKLNFPLLNV